MEQKQLDELDESYFGEEFIDENAFDEVKVEDVKPKKAVKKKVTKSTKSSKSSKVKEEVKEEKKVEDKPKESIKDSKESVKDQKEESVKDSKKEPLFKETKKVDEKDSLSDPWGDEPDEAGFFKEVSTWKAITGIVVILLVFSIFTQGFQFAEGNTITGAATSITLTEAETAALSFVNNNLLQPPFEAELTSSEETAGLFKVTLSVAGQQVDSYITKDGKLFFPQGFDTATDPLATPGAENTEMEKVPTQTIPSETTPSETTPTETVTEETSTSEETTPVEVPKEEVKKDPVVVPEPTPVPTVPPATLSVAAKKWLFEPSQLTVKEGQKVNLAVNPIGLDFTFAIDDLGVSKEVKGNTMVEFTASKKGTFEFKCGSCEDWRGMAGTIVVE